MNHTETQRLAAMAHALRPDWPVPSLITWLEADHASRAYRDVAVALAWVACDTDTRTPKRMNEMGPWWGATGTASTSATDVRFDRCPEPGHSSFPAWNCSACRSEDLEPDYTRGPAPDADTLAAHQLEVNQRGIAEVRAALRDARGVRMTLVSRARCTTCGWLTDPTTQDEAQKAAEKHLAPGHPTDAPTVSERDER